jgi:starch-binding outer membrane protein, SusD/RagB family
MRNSRSTSIRAAGLVALLLASPGCTDLDEQPISSITPGQYYQNEQEVLGGLAAIYAQLRSTLDAYYNLSEVSTDEVIVPTRGSDWFDNGRWLEIHRHDWGASSPSGLDDVRNAWVVSWVGVSRANVLLAALENVAVPNKEALQAEARALRAFYYYQLLDFFGGLPIVETPDIAERPRATRAETFAFIESELKAARELLPAQWPATSSGRFTKGACDAILANMYLNAQVFTGEVTASGLQPGQERWQDAINSANDVLNAGVYSLATDWRSTFTAANDNSPENIFVVKHTAAADLGLNFLMRTLHYNQFTPSPWNGFATLAETYFAFDDADARKQIFLVGPQVNLETGAPVNNRQGEPLVFTPEIADVTAATEGEGVRIGKWPPDPNHVAQNNGNDFAYFRLAEIYLIKAEALNEQGNTGEAVNLVNELRARVFEPDQPLTIADQAAFRDAILQERLRELTFEAKRRQDLIRHGKYTSGAWGVKEPSEPYRILFPIPQTQLDANPQLTQNAGY